MYTWIVAGRPHPGTGTVQADRWIVGVTANTAIVAVRIAGTVRHVAGRALPAAEALAEVTLRVTVSVV